MTTTITKEQLQRIIESADDVLSAQAGTNEDVHPESDDMIRLWDYLNDVAAPPAVVKRLAEIALASLEVEPVGTFRKGPCGYSPYFHEDAVPLYAAPPAPVVDAEPVADVVAWHKEGEERTCDIRWRRFDVAPGPLFAVAQLMVKVPDALPENDDEDGNDIDYMEPTEVYALGRRDGWNACRAEILKNSASVKPSTDAGCVTNNPSNYASVKDHQIRELVNELRDIAVEYHGTHQLRERIARTVRAAMLNHSENERDMAEPVSQPYKLPPNSFTNDDLEMMAHGDNPQANAYRELLVFRRNSPVIPDGWIAVSERMPEMHTPVWCFGSIPEVSGKEFGFEGWLTMGGFVAENNSSSPGGCEKAIVTHWMQLPAAPHQEGK